MCFLLIDKKFRGKLQGDLPKTSIFDPASFKLTKEAFYRYKNILDRGKKGLKSRGIWRKKMKPTIKENITKL